MEKNIGNRVREHEIEVTGGLGTYKTTGTVNVRPKDVENAVRCYFMLRNPKETPPSTIEKGKISINIKYRYL